MVSWSKRRLLILQWTLCWSFFRNSPVKTNIKHRRNRQQFVCSLGDRTHSDLNRHKNRSRLIFFYFHLFPHFLWIFIFLIFGSNQVEIKINFLLLKFLFHSTKSCNKKINWRFYLKIFSWSVWLNSICSWNEKRKKMKSLVILNLTSILKCASCCKLDKTWKFIVSCTEFARLATI